ncbi:hypothetical protein EJB05_39428 [Eragrostis curvula]|uniref:BHLH domain-containing protein n=1 Tax=Eragrostis curvula TaxID=38414 RepID=A0A5J9TX58_9POAL|nr:hypothetical protein EJB05_39428 [Eragrostis curvula]
MIVGGGYFDGSPDQSLMAESFIHDSSQAPKHNDNTSIELQKFTVPSFSTEVLSKPADFYFQDAGAINHLQHQLGIYLEQGGPQGETASWDPSVGTIQDHIVNHQFGEYSHHISVEQQIQHCDGLLHPNGAYTPAPDLLNLFQCTLPSAFPTATSVIGDTTLHGEITGITAIPESGMMFTGDPQVQLRYPAQTHLAKDICYSQPRNHEVFPGEDDRDVIIGIGSVGDIFQEIDDRQFDSMLGCRRGKGELRKRKVKANFATERERREQLNVKYRTLRMLFSNPTKNDRASIVGDAIEYIDELNRTVKELKILVEQKKHGHNREKMIKLDHEADADGVSSSMRQVRDDQDSQLNGTIRSSWIHRRSKECHVDVRIVDDEVNIKLAEKKKANSLFHAAKVLDEFKLELIHAVGGIIGDHHIFMLNTKVPEGSSVYACAVAKRLLEAVDAQHCTFNVSN